MFCGDPVFAGIYSHNTTTTTDGRSLADTAHVAGSWRTKDHRTTLVLPAERGIHTVLHEIGHVIQDTLYERTGDWGPTLTPVTEYAATNVWETFAEAFTAWFYPPRQRDVSDHWFGFDRGNDEFFDRLGSE